MLNSSTQPSRSSWRAPFLHDPGPLAASYSKLLAIHLDHFRLLCNAKDLDLRPLEFPNATSHLSLPSALSTPVLYSKVHSYGVTLCLMEIPSSRNTDPIHTAIHLSPEQPLAPAQSPSLAGRSSCTHSRCAEGAQLRPLMCTGIAVYGISVKADVRGLPFPSTDLYVGKS
jgi:hypothetical protein